MKEIVKSRLVKIASDNSGWDTLYLDKETKLYYEKIYPDSNLHGGGQAKYKQTSLTDSIIDKYKIE